MAGRSSTTQSDSQVEARAQAEQVSRQNDDPAAGLEEQAAEQEAQQKEELRQGAKAKKDPAQESDVPAVKRTGMVGQPATVNGFMDQMSRRSADDVMEGHFCRVDLNDKEVKQAYKDVGLEGHRGDYGVYLEPATLEPDSGIPLTAVVRLRDETSARVVVPYDALTPAQAGGR